MGVVLALSTQNGRPVSLSSAQALHSASSMAGCSTGSDNSVARDAGASAEPVDCVAVLGTIPSTLAQTPLARIPYSGISRDKLISALSDGELGKLCDFDVCIRANGYLRNCYPFPGLESLRNRPEQPFRLESHPLVAESMVTCYPNPNPTDGRADVTWLTRDGCIEIYRKNFGACHVGSWEDCLREGAYAPLASTWAPSCEVTKSECPLF